VWACIELQVTVSHEAENRIQCEVSLVSSSAFVACFLLFSEGTALMLHVAELPLKNIFQLHYSSFLYSCWSVMTCNRN